MNYKLNPADISDTDFSYVKEIVYIGMTITFVVFILLTACTSEKGHLCTLHQTQSQPKE